MYRNHPVICIELNDNPIGSISKVQKNHCMSKPIWYQKQSTIGCLLTMKFQTYTIAHNLQNMHCNEFCWRQKAQFNSWSTVNLISDLIHSTQSPANVNNCITKATMSSGAIVVIFKCSTMIGARNLLAKLYLNNVSLDHSHLKYQHAMELVPNSSEDHEHTLNFRQNVWDLKAFHFIKLLENCTVANPAKFQWVVTTLYIHYISSWWKDAQDHKLCWMQQARGPKPEPFSISTKCEW